MYMYIYIYIYIWFIAQIGAMEQGRKQHEDSCIPFRMVAGGFLGGPLGGIAGAQIIQTKSDS